MASDHGRGKGAPLDGDDLGQVGVDQATHLDRGGVGADLGCWDSVTCPWAGQGDLGVGPAAIVGHDRLGHARRSIDREPADDRGADAMETRRVRRDRDPGCLQVRPKSYRPVPHSQPGSSVAGSGPGCPRGPRVPPRVLRSARLPRRTPPRTPRRGARRARPAPGPRRRASAASASARRVDTPASGTPSDWARPRAVATPMRRPVKVPGPTPTATRSTCPQSSPALGQQLGGQLQQPSRVRRPRAGHRVVAPLQLAPVRQPRAAAVDAVAVSKPSTIMVERSRSTSAAAVTDPGRPPRRCDDLHRRAAASPPGRRPAGRRAIASGHSMKAIGRVRGSRRAASGSSSSSPPSRYRSRWETVTLLPRVAMADAERRTGDRPEHAERASGAADERRLARAQLAAHEHDVSRTQARGQPRAQRLGLLRSGGVDGERGGRQRLRTSGHTASPL